MRPWDEIVSDSQLTPVQRLGRLVVNVATLKQEASDEAIDVGFTYVHVNDEAVTDSDIREALLDALDYGEGEFTRVDQLRFETGLGYIELGAWLGNQSVALAFMGLVEYFNLADVMTPARLGITGDEAKEMMGMGLVMLVPNVAELY